MSTLLAGVALAAQELGDLRFQSYLEQQPDAKPCYLFQDLAKFPAGLEEFIELGTKPLAGGYSS